MSLRSREHFSNREAQVETPVVVQQMMRKLDRFEAHTGQPGTHLGGLAYHTSTVLGGQEDLQEDADQWGRGVQREGRRDAELSGASPRRRLG